MFNIDPKLRARIARQTERVLVIDPNVSAARVLIDLLKDMGAGQRLHAATTKKALEIAAEWQPQLVFVEFAGPGLDGVDFTTRLRRSGVVARKAPVIVVTADTREASIKASRDSGAHEFLVKPFTAGHVFRRVENVTLKPRPWIEAQMYVGPDRRRFNSGQFEGKRKRRADTSLTTAAALAYASADTAIRAQLDLIEQDPQTALKHMMAQAVELQSAATGQSETELGRAIGSLQKYLVVAMDRGGLRRETVEEHLSAIRLSRERSVANLAPKAAPVLQTVTI